MTTERAFRVLGPLDVEVAGCAVALGGQRRRSLLSRLLIQPNRVVSADRLIEDLWGEDATPRTTNTLQVGISALRTALEPDPEARTAEPVLVHESGGYVLRVEDGQLDVQRFERLVADGRRLLGIGEPERAAAELSRAVELFRGQPLQDLAGLPCSEPEIARLCEEREAAIEDRIDALLASGAHGTAVPELERLTIEAPFRERRWAQLMLALYRSGRQSDALRTYERVRAMLREELGVDPSPLLRDLEHRMLQQRPDLDAQGGVVAAPVHGTMTIVFTDLVGSTALSERLGDVEFERILTRHMDDVRRVTETSGGHVVRLVGDGALLRFASATAAVQAAIDIQRMTDGTGLGVKVGLDAGEPVERPDHDVIGTPVNRAARLCEAASGGEILVSTTVRALVESRGEHHFSAPRTLELKGLDGPQQVHAVRWSGSTRSLRHPPALVATDEYVGRDDAMAAARAAWRRTVAGDGGLCLVRGEPGSGKTRLLAELSREVYSSGGVVLYGRCTRDGSAFQPFHEALHRYVGEISDAELHHMVGIHGPEISTIVPAVASRLGVAPSAGLDPSLQRLRMEEAVGEFFLRLSEHARTLVVLDDLHWADVGTTQLLAAVAPISGAQLLALTYRSTEVDRSDPIAATIADLEEYSIAPAIDLSGFDVDEVARCASARAGRPCDDAVAAHIHARTGGNPLLVEELTHHLLDDGTFDDPAAVGDADAVPATMEALVDERLRQHGDVEIAIAEAASILGAEFDWESIPLVTDEDEGVVVDALDHLVATGILFEVRGTAGRYGFVHDLVRQALAGRLGTARRQFLHRRAADALEELGGGTPPDVAHHRMRGISPATKVEARESAVAAAEYARHQIAHAEAARWYERAVGTIDDGDDAATASLCLPWADLLVLAGDVDRAREVFQEAAVAAERVGDATTLARAAVGLMGNAVGVWVRWGKSDDELVRWLDRADMALGPLPTTERVLVLSARAALLRATDPAEADRWSAAALELADVLQDPAAIKAALLGRRMAIWRPDCLDERIRLDRRLLDMAGDELLHDQFDALTCLMIDQLEAGNMAAADAITGRVEGVAELLDWPLARWNSIRYRTMRRAMGGDLDGALQLAAEALAVGHTVGPENAIGSFGAVISGVALLRDQVDGIGDTIAATAVEMPGLSPYAAMVPLYLGEEGRIGDAAAALDGIRADLDELAMGPDWLTTVTSLAYSANLLGDVSMADAVRPMLEPFASLHVVAGGMVYSLGPVERFLGLLADTQGDVDAADDHFRRAATAGEELGAEVWLAMNSVEHARCLRRHDRDPGRVEALLDDAAARAERYDLGLVRRKIDETKERT